MKISIWQFFKKKTLFR